MPQSVSTTINQAGLRRILFYSTIFQITAMACVLLAQAYFLFPAEDSISPAGFYLMANIVAVSGLAFAASVSPRFEREARLPLFAAGVVFAALFVYELRWNSETWLSDGAAFALWVFAAVSLTYLVRLETLPRMVRRAFRIAVILQGIAVAADLIDDGALGLTAEDGALDWIYLAANLASMAAYQIALLHVLSEGRLIPVVKRAVKYVGETIAAERFAGALPGAASDPRYAKWKEANPGRPYSEYYAHRISERLDQGLSHKTLGGRVYQSEKLAAKARDYEPAAFRREGRSYFDWFAARALRRDMTCVDFGCGSLRVGQHFIRHLEPGRYLGLDVVDRFYKAGIGLIGAETITDKRPRFGVISPEELARAAALKPDLVYSTAVLQHVPPEELDAYLDKLLGLISANGVAIANFRVAGALVRTATSNWEYEPGRLFDAVSRVDPHVHAAMLDGRRRPTGRFGQATLAMARDPATLLEWTRSPDARNAAVPSALTSRKSEGAA